MGSPEPQSLPTEVLLEQVVPFLLVWFLFPWAFTLALLRDGLSFTRYIKYKDRFSKTIPPLPPSLPPVILPVFSYYLYQYFCFQGFQAPLKVLQCLFLSSSEGNNVNYWKKQAGIFTKVYLCGFVLAEGCTWKSANGNLAHRMDRNPEEVCFSSEYFTLLKGCNLYEGVHIYIHHSFLCTHIKTLFKQLFQVKSLCNWHVGKDHL